MALSTEALVFQNRGDLNEQAALKRNYEPAALKRNYELPRRARYYELGI